jgi:hypothetical protein
MNNFEVLRVWSVMATSEIKMKTLAIVSAINQTNNASSHKFGLESA